MDNVLILKGKKDTGTTLSNVCMMFKLRQLFKKQTIMNPSEERISK
jgi:hypothetical protein